MKALLIAIVILGISLSNASAASLKATWEYVSPPDLVGFTIYLDGVEAWTENNLQQRECVFDCDLTGESVGFTLTARDAINENMPSEIFYMDPPPPAPTSLSVSQSE